MSKLLGYGLFFEFNCDFFLYQVGLNGTEFEHALSEGANPKGTAPFAINMRVFTNSNELSQTQNHLQSGRPQTQGVCNHN